MFKRREARRDDGVIGDDFSPALWLKQNYGLDLPAEPEALLPASWDVIDAEDSDIRSFAKALFKPQNPAKNVLAQALDLHRTASSVARLAHPTRGPKDERAVDLAGAFEKAVEELGPIPPDLRQTLGIERLIAALDSAAKHLDHYRAALLKLGLAPPSRPGRPAAIPTQAANQWLQGAGLDLRGRAAALLYLGILSTPAVIVERVLPKTAEATRKIPPLSRPTRPCLHPLLGLVQMAAISEAARRGGIGTGLALSARGSGVILGAVPPGEPPPVVPAMPDHPWAWVPFPYWAIPDHREFKDIRTWVRLAAPLPPQQQRNLEALLKLYQALFGSADWAALQAVLNQLAAPEETDPTSSS